MKERPRTMSDDLKVEKINIINLYDDYVSGKLSINRRYQRKLVWDLQEKKILFVSTKRLFNGVSF